tara:strand:+ start:83637 stop:83801 length:165 start_codon:yes stop_codon:yes gene_type:complete
MTLEQIKQLVLPETMVVRSKSWQDFTGINAPELDLVLTVCDNSAAIAKVMRELS